MEALLAGLNPEQRAAVVHPAGPLLVLAGAGSGKTRVLTLRIAWLINELDVAPWRILALTFTNKAAREMKERVGRLLGSETPECWVSTFHSACLRMLRRDIELLSGYGSDFVIYDDRDSLELVKRILKEMKAPSTVNPRGIRAVIDRAKNDARSPEQLAASPPPDADARSAAVYAEYQRRLRQANALDFGDLILKTIELLQQHPSIQERYQGRFRHILVDEYQDTNPAQYLLLRLLVEPAERNVCVVGDEDQSIYSFRGADIRNILDFERDFPGATTVRLERNYRSTQTILEAATAVVEHNLERKGKRLWTDREGGDLITLRVAYDDRDEARMAAGIARDELHSGRQPRDIAVFYRTNAQSRLIEEEFLASRLPFVLIGGQRFFERSEVKDTLSFLRAVANPRDDVATERIINRPPRGIGAKTIDTLARDARRVGGSLWDAVVRASGDGSILSSRARKAVAAFRTIMDELREARADHSLPELVELVLHRSGMVERLESEGTFESDGKLANLQELHSSTLEWAAAPPATALTDFLDRVSLVADADSIPDEDAEAGRITLMTVHASKGLEFPVVIVVGMDEGLFPHSRATTFQSELEEERRLAYVAITRAQTRLFLLRARRRPAQGRLRGQGYMDSQPSRFLRHIPRELLTGDSGARAVGGGVRSASSAAIAAAARSSERYVEYDEAGPFTPATAGARSRFAHRAAASGYRPGPPGPATSGFRTAGRAIGRPAPPGRPQVARPAPPGRPQVSRAGDRADQLDLLAGLIPGAPGDPQAPEGRDEPDCEPRFVPDGDALPLRVGARVLHPRFGEGEIRVLEGRPDNLRATIFFRSGGNKKIFLRHAELELISH